MTVKHMLSPQDPATRDRLRIAVVGTGLLGERHARFWGQQDDVDLVGLIDLDNLRATSAAERLATTYGIPRPPAFTSLDELLETSAADAVSVATPDFAHRDPVVRALDAGLHVLVEKPLAMTTEDARTMTDASRRAGRWLMVNHSMRWIPRYRAIHDAIRTGQWGQMVVAHSAKSDVIHVPTAMLSWASRTSAAYFLTAHDLDLVRWFAGDRIVRVFAQGARGVLDRNGIDAYDAIQSSVTFGNGSIASFEASWIHPKTYPSFTDDYMHVICENGVAYLDRGREGTEIFEADRVRHPKHSTVYEQDGRIYGSFRHALEHFTHCIRAGIEPLTSARRVTGVVSALEAIHRSLETGMPEPVDDGAGN